MRVTKVGMWVWLLGVALAVSAASEQELFRAARSGQVAALQAALKAGANVNTKFDVGKTALMVAAENGRDAAVEALMDAGADLYVLDNNHWDALSHAAMGRHISTVKLMLRKGLNPSNNNWRALAIVRGEVGGNMDARKDSRLTQVRAILEEAYQRGGAGTVGGLSGSPSPAPTPVLRREEKIASPVFINVSEMKLTPEMFKTMATKALSQRGWTNITAERDQLTGTYSKKDREYRAQILFRPPLIKISFVEGYGAASPDWLLNLKTDLEFEINMALTR